MMIMIVNKCIHLFKHWPRDKPLSAKVGSSFADERRSLGWFSLLAEKSHGVIIIIIIYLFTKLLNSPKANY
jgi:hypothetical protein